MAHHAIVPNPGQSNKLFQVLCIGASGARGPAILLTNDAVDAVEHARSCVSGSNAHFAAAHLWVVECECGRPLRDEALASACLYVSAGLAPDGTRREYFTEPSLAAAFSMSVARNGCPSRSL